MSGRNIDRLLARAGRNNELTFCECKLGDEDYSFYVKPLTPAQFEEASKPDRKGNTPSQLVMSIKLFTLRALNADGSRQYQTDAFPALMRMPLEDLQVLVNAVPGGDDEEAELDIKSTQQGAEAEKPVDSGISGGRKTREDAD